MNSEPVRERSGLAYTLAVLGAFLIVIGLVWAMKNYSKPAPLDANRAAQRSKALKEMHAAENEALTTPAWIDEKKGIVRLPIDDAVQIVERTWGKNPAAARSNLISRVEKATAVAPPPPNPFE